MSELPPKRRTLISIIIHPNRLRLIPSNVTVTSEHVAIPDCDSRDEKNRVSGGGGKSQTEPIQYSSAGEIPLTGDDDNGVDNDDDGDDQEEEGRGGMGANESGGSVQEEQRDSTSNGCSVEEEATLGEDVAGMDHADLGNDDQSRDPQLGARTVYELVGKAKVKSHKIIISI